jgi:carbamoylphosphate synthase large subunit
MTQRPRILFGEHSTQQPAIERYVDHDRYDVRFAALDRADFGDAELVVPLSVVQIDAARRAGPERTLLPSAELVELCDDKLAWNRRLIALGFGDAIPALLEDPPATFPYIRKARRGNYGSGIRLVRAPGEDEPIPDSFCQRAVEGRYEYVLHLIRAGRRTWFDLCYRYDMAAPLSVRGGADRPAATEPADPAPAMELSVAILDALGFEGTCCFNYKLEDGRPLFLELNPRFGGSLVGEVTRYLDAHLAAMGRRAEPPSRSP